jgi:primosomal protein N''
MIPLMGAVQGLAGIAGGIIGSGKRKREQKEAQAEFNRNKQRMEGLDTSNLAVNQENTMEDLTVNTQQSDFINQQQQAGMANTMDKLSGAAGGSGIAALAQSLSQQQTANAQSASASIGQQEAKNQMAERQMAGKLQSQELQGAYDSRAAEKDKTETMLGMSQQRLGAANDARDAATKSIIGGVAGAAGSIVPSLPGIADQKGEGSMLGNMLG